ncbi:conserved hypothetical protein [Ricinus communis]|uniref:Uncharacterized protein n=1 Tax=Ricinus communis TaxID=3988 RepID=B9S2L5_RICCO|nr:conserved hypothetical protein [Ricinus communis]
MGLHGYQITWERSRGLVGWVKEKLDRGVTLRMWWLGAGITLLLTSFKESLRCEDWSFPNGEELWCVTFETGSRSVKREWVFYKIVGID